MGGEITRKLTGWKELAEYLGTSPRTVQRWEREKGLPVRRVPGSNGHSVFADSGELDRWLDSGDLGTSMAVGGSGRASGIRASLEKRHPALRLAAVAGLALAVAAFGAGLVRPGSAKSGKISIFRTLETATAAPVITSISRIEAKANQVILIKGQGLGVHTYYANGDIPYIAIRDTTVRWAAGRIIPENWDEVTLDVAYWIDSEIVVTGFAGAYGQHWWKLNPGDEIEVAVWNPQTHAGPALYHLIVSSRQLAQK